MKTARPLRRTRSRKPLPIALFTGKLVLGEDSGLQVKALGNRPGIYSARYSGPKATDKKNNLKLLRELKGVPLKKRTARYQCAVALADGQTVDRRRFREL